MTHGDMRRPCRRRGADPRWSLPGVRFGRSRLPPLRSDRPAEFGGQVGTTIAGRSVISEETENPGALEHGPRQLSHPQHDVAAGLREIGTCPIAVKSQGTELSANPVRFVFKRFEPSSSAAPGPGGRLSGGRGSREPAASRLRPSTGRRAPASTHALRVGFLHRCLRLRRRGKSSAHLDRVRARGRASGAPGRVAA